MSQTLPSNDAPIAATALMAERLADLQAQVEALDRGVIETGLTASRALEKAETVAMGMQAAWSAAGLEGKPGDPQPVSDDSRTASFGDPRSARIQARRSRIERSGFVLIYGGES
jgi:hypothetical protein